MTKPIFGNKKTEALPMAVMKNGDIGRKPDHPVIQKAKWLAQRAFVAATCFFAVIGIVSTAWAVWTYHVDPSHSPSAFLTSVTVERRH